MKKILTAFCVLMTVSAPAQTLFTYGKNAVSAPDFIRAFQKNNNGSKTKNALKEYLDLYVASRLKVAEAKEKGFDTLPQLVSDLNNLRQQILPNYLADKESVNGLVAEAFARSQKDIHIAHLFIAFTKNGVTDSAVAKNRLDEVTGLLKKGTAFEEAARLYSDDPSAKGNGGDLGWVTAFSLPYELENVAYATGAGNLSGPYRSRAGYHIFKNLGERKALGRIKAAQILLAFPPGAEAATKAAIKKEADSLYNRLQKGDDFGRLATTFSNDVISSASNGQLQEFGVGEYDPVFEKAAFNLSKDGSVSAPFLTTHGYHIVQRIKGVPVAAKLDAATREGLRYKVEASDRIQTAKAAMMQKVIKAVGYKKLFSDAELWAYSDSVLKNQAPKINTRLTPSTTLFQLGTKTVKAREWIAYLPTSRYKADGTTKDYPQVWDDFLESMALQYYGDHLENFDEDFRRQLTEFAEGNLFFEIMQRNVWTPAQTDTVALANYYEKNKSSYYWKHSADAVIFYATDAASAKEFWSQLSSAPQNWKGTLSGYTEKITADSSRFEVTQLPNATAQPLHAKGLTQPLVNKGDNTVSFAYVIKLYPKQEPRSFTEAKGLVVNDYQAAIEKDWVAGLKKKYPVKLNEQVWKDVVVKIAGGK